MEDDRFNFPSHMIDNAFIRAHVEENARVNIFLMKRGILENSFYVEVLNVESNYLCKSDKDQIWLYVIGKKALLKEMPGIAEEGKVYRKRLQLIIFLPRIEGQKFIERYGWNNPVELVDEAIKDLREVAGGRLRYEIAETHWKDYFPLKIDGFQYNEDSYIRCWEYGECHESDLSDYMKILEDFDSCEKRNNGEIDEIWMF